MSDSDLILLSIRERNTNVKEINSRKRQICPQCDP
jgi:hypothetical protein